VFLLSHEKLVFLKEIHNQTWPHTWNIKLYQKPHSNHLFRGVIEAKSEGRKILLTDFDYANGAHNEMTNIKTDIKINNFLNFITIFLYKNLLNFTFNILRMQSKQYLLWSKTAVFQCIHSKWTYLIKYQMGKTLININKHTWVFLLS